MPAFCHQVHLRWVRVRLGDQFKTPTLRTLPTLTKAASGYLLAWPPFAESFTPLAGLPHPADAACTGVAASTSASTSTALPVASVTVAWRTTVASALPRRMSAYMAPNSPDS